MPKRIQLRRAKGWRIPPGTVKVDRSTIWGNPWTVPGDFANAAGAVHRFRNALVHAPRPHPESKMGIILDGLWALRGKDLACWCKLSEPCHADVLLELANK